jgi:hypothetical protein
MVLGLHSTQPAKHRTKIACDAGDTGESKLWAVAVCLRFLGLALRPPRKPVSLKVNSPKYNKPDCIETLVA